MIDDRLKFALGRLIDLTLINTINASNEDERNELIQFLKESIYSINTCMRGIDSLPEKKELTDEMFEEIIKNVEECC